jgi:hypothetical protein
VSPDFLTRSGFPLTRDGEIYNAGAVKGLTQDQVWDMFFRLWFWPESWPGKREERVEQRLCGGRASIG